MTQKHIKHIVPGLTAIAAVLALHATPVAAQETVPPTTTDTAPAPSPDPVPVASDPLAPEASSTATTAEPVPSATTTSTRATNRAPRSTTRAPAPRTTPAAAAPASPSASSPAEPATPLAAEPVAIEPPPVAATPAPEPVATDAMDEYLPIAGAAGAGLLALAGIGLAAGRRRKREEEEQWAYNEAVTGQPVAVEPEPAMARSEPAMTVVPAAAASVAKPRADGTVQASPRASHVSAFTWGNQSFAKRPEPKADPTPPKVAASNLPKGFDVSRFGRHVQAAYMGPTPDNPSLSLKNRLRRASFFDKVERDTGQPHPLVAEVEYQQ